MTESEVEPFLTSVLRDVFERDDIVVYPEMTALDLVGWDSFKQIEILLAIEEGIGVRFKPSEVRSLGTVGDLARLVLAHAPAPAS